MLGEEPPIVMFMVSIKRPQDGALKHTAANIVRTGEFVAHPVDEPMAGGCTAAGSVSRPA